MVEKFHLGDGVFRAGNVRPYRPRPNDPVHRPLNIFSTNPGDSSLDGSRVVARVPYEELKPGPVGHYFEVIGDDYSTTSSESPLNLNDPRLMCTSGMPPSMSRPFHMQMTYAVGMLTYEAFRMALGRDLNWGFGDSGKTRLKLYPYHSEMQNAYYSREAGAVHFGWYQTKDRLKDYDAAVGHSPRNLWRGKFYTSLSHDIIAHEVSHALLDGLRPNFMYPFHHDTLALHEGFADLVAIFQHFSHRELLRAAIRQSKGQIKKSHLLTDVARQFGQTISQHSSLRSAIDRQRQCGADEETDDRVVYDPQLGIHGLGSVLVSSVFDAFITVFDRKARRFIKIATQGSGVLPEGDLDESLADVLGDLGSKLANQFLSICIRAIDYCPPVACTFGDFLRAMITADHNLVPDDPYRYREALVDAFIARQVPIEDVESLGEASLLWPDLDYPMDDGLLTVIQEQSYEFTRDDDSDQMNQARYVARARRIGAYLCKPEHLEKLGLYAPGRDYAEFASVTPPTIESARISRRVSSDRRLLTELIVEITQQVTIERGGCTQPILHGCTVIADSGGKIRHIIRKHASQVQDQFFKQLDDCYLTREDHWDLIGEGWQPRKGIIAAIHRHESQSRT
ncbi:hypothetical protein [Roseiconus lacunae]|uniref:Peptidase M4 n=1 Tax=Roseiconus lacunae TaxID=2605694 RepID=A0ABT7PH41_9BACT|nr:hypothetical protein [Roseiconus lacunae]MDM4015802.1 hypothetical protein [Roseiconus lacunae]